MWREQQTGGNERAAKTLAEAVDKRGRGTYRGRGEDAAAAEGARLVAGDARVKVGRRLRAALGVLDLCIGRRRQGVSENRRQVAVACRVAGNVWHCAHLLLGGKGHVEEELRRHDEHVGLRTRNHARRKTRRCQFCCRHAGRTVS